MLHFESDYNEGAHENILRALAETNHDKQPGYGGDGYCQSAKQKIRRECDAPDADIYFLTGGTQTNQTVISAMLSGYEGVMSATTGHINAHEAGAIESTGHKVIEIEGKNGKLSAKSVRDYIAAFYADENYEHMVFPGMAYISHPTEYGTVYTKAELGELSSVCREYDIPLYMDGARLGYGLMAEGADVTLRDIAKLCDAFYIGGTKVGALFGEAVVFPRGNAPKHFFTLVKQHGALLAKGWLAGLQFDMLFTDRLYYEISKNAVEKAGLIKEALRRKGYEFYIDSPTNQIFILLDNNRLKQLEEEISFGFWERVGSDKTVVRIATSWATTRAEAEELIARL